MDYEEILLECETKMEDSISSMDKRFTNVRAGRANPNMLDGITVEYYGTDTPLKQLANISVPEARQSGAPDDSGLSAVQSFGEGTAASAGSDEYRTWRIPCLPQEA